MSAAPVQVHDLDPDRVETRPSNNVGLDGGVGDVLILHGGGGLDLGDHPSVRLTRQDVHGNEDVGGEEGRFVDDRGTLVERLPGSGNTTTYVVVREIDQDTAGKIRAGKIADDVASLRRLSWGEGTSSGHRVRTCHQACGDTRPDTKRLFEGDAPPSLLPHAVGARAATSFPVPPSAHLNHG